MIAKCANPACGEIFKQQPAGKFFRFRNESRVEVRTRGRAHGQIREQVQSEVVHFWLCPCCCKFFTLVYLEETGVLLQPREEEAAEESHEMTAAR